MSLTKYPDSLDHITATVHSYSTTNVPQSTLLDLFKAASFSGETFVTSASNGISYDTGNGRFSVVRDATYRIKAFCTIRKTNAVTTSIQLIARKTGSASIVGSWVGDGTSSDSVQLWIEGLIELTASDYLNFELYTTEAAGDYQIFPGHSVTIEEVKNFL